MVEKLCDQSRYRCSSETYPITHIVHKPRAEIVFTVKQSYVCVALQYRLRKRAVHLAANLAKLFSERSAAGGGHSRIVPRAAARAAAARAVRIAYELGSVPCHIKNPPLLLAARVCVIYAY